MSSMCKMLSYLLAVSIIMFVFTGYIERSFPGETLATGLVFSIRRISYFAMLGVSGLSVPVSLFAIAFRKVRGIRAVFALMLLLASLIVLTRLLL